MSKESLTQFLKKVGGDAKLRRELDGLFRRAAGQPAATAASVVEFAAKHGFKFTTTELKAHVAAAGKSGELSESEMDAVAGGLLFQALCRNELVNNENIPELTDNENIKTVRKTTGGTN